MKRFTLFLLFLSCMSICGCAGREKKPIPIPAYPVTMEVTLSTGGESFDMTVFLVSPGEGEIIIHSPETLSGFSLGVSPSEVELRYGDTELPLHSEKIKSTVFTVIGGLCAGEDSILKTASVTEDGISVTEATYDCGGCEMLCRFDSASGKPLSAEFRGEEFNASLIIKEYIKPETQSQ